jgi:phosphoserine phosphatase RsbU/P
VILDQVDHTTVFNPILWRKGIRSMMGVPLTAGGRVIGVMHVGSLTSRQFTSADVELLQLAADRAATAVQSIETRADRVAAACCRPRCRRSRERSWPPGVLRAAAWSAGTGTTCSRCRRGSWAS